MAPSTFTHGGELLRRGADEDLQLALLRLGQAAEHGGVDHMEAGPVPPGQLPEGVWADGRRLDERRTLRQALGDAVGAEDHLLERIRIGQHRNGGLGISGRRSGALGQLGAEVRRVGLLGRAVPDREVVAGGDEPGGHGQPRLPGAAECQFRHCRRLPRIGAGVP